MKSHAGLSLVEVMISITLSLLLLGSLITIYLALEKSTESLSSLSLLQENTMLVTSLLREAVETAGYIGCARLTDNFPLTNHTQLEFDVSHKITQDNQGVLTLRHGSLESAALVKAMRGWQTIYTTDDVAFSKDDIVIISDCKSADIFTIKTVSKQADESQKITVAEPLAHLYQTDAEVRYLEVDNYSVKDTLRKSKDGEPIYALYLSAFNKKSLELVEGINAMQIQFNTHEKETTGASFTLDLVSGDLKKTGYVYATLKN